MSTSAAIRSLFDEVGPILQGVDIFEIDALQAYQVVFPGNISIQVYPNADRGILVFESGLGTPSLEFRPKLYPMLLGINRVWQETDGLRFSVEPEDGEVVLLWDVATDILTADSLASILFFFAERVALWADVVLRGVDDADSSTPNPSETGMIQA